MAATYVDSSAIVKLAVEEPESAELRHYLRRREVVSSALSRTEVMRAVLGSGDSVIRSARRALRVVELLRVNDRVLNAAGTLLPAELRALDAIHIATAQELGDQVGTFVTYDARMADAAGELGYRVSAPQ